MGTYWGFISLRGWSILLYIGGRGRGISDMIYKEMRLEFFSLFFVFGSNIKGKNKFLENCLRLCVFGVCDGRGSVYVENLQQFKG